MAQKRMLNKSISLSRKANRLSLKSALIYTWSIPHLDDWALITNDSEGIKAAVVPRRKEISVRDIEKFIEEAQIPDEEGNTLITVYKDCIEFNGYFETQTISEEKRAKTKFSKIPKIPQENIGKNNIPHNLPVQISIDKFSLTKKSVVAPEVASPKQISSRFFSEPSEQDSIIYLLVEKGVSENLARGEMVKFVDYWTELNPAGTKQRWQMQKTFEVKRRLATWFSRSREFSGVNKSKVAFL